MPAAMLLKCISTHGYHAVDFFFLLSGFVIAHAYDDRGTKMSIKDFFKRRLIRLHLMIIIGMTIGAICFYFSASTIVFPANYWNHSCGKLDSSDAYRVYINTGSAIA